MKRLFALLFLFCIAILHGENVVIVGGGPAGLSSALEAKSLGADVLVIEKRSRYSRLRILFLDSHSLKLLQKWNVKVPEMQFMDRFGIVQINGLENALESRCKELGIRILHEECLDIDKKRHLVLTKTQEIPYDVLVAADGTHSCLREALGITTTVYDQAIAAIAFLSCEPSEVGIDPIIEMNSFFARKVGLPTTIFLFIQGKNKVSAAQIFAAAKEMRWVKENVSIEQCKAVFHEDIDVVLQQATAFSDREASVLIVGDAAATASFLQGKGANTALNAAMRVGQFLTTKSYEAFDQAMKADTDALIEDSRYLFSQDTFLQAPPGSPTIPTTSN